MSNEYGFFNVLSHILYGKELKDENLNDFSLFMFNRWVSMRSPQDCEFVNMFLNTYPISKLDDKESVVKFLQRIVPKMKYSKIDYIKKSSKESTKKSKSDIDDEKMINFLASQLEISKRESKLLVENKKFRESDDFKELKKSLKYI